MLPRCLRCVLLLIVAVYAPALCQITPQQEGVTTDSLDLFSTVPADSMRSPGLAMAANLLLPGLGHQYLHRPGRALSYFSTELAFLFGAIFFERYSQRLMDNSRTLAWLYAGTRGGAGADGNYWRVLGSYLDVDGYNHVQELNRTPQYKYVEPQLAWAWIDTSYMKEYNRTRDDATSYHIASTFFIGAMVLNRVVSFVDARITTRRRISSGRLSSLNVHPTMGHGLTTVGINVSTDF